MFYFSVSWHVKWVRQSPAGTRLLLWVSQCFLFWLGHSGPYSSYCVILYHLCIWYIMGYGFFSLLYCLSFPLLLHKGGVWFIGHKAGNTLYRLSVLSHRRQVNVVLQNDTIGKQHTQLLWLVHLYFYCMLRYSISKQEVAGFKPATGCYCLSTALYTKYCNLLSIRIWSKRKI